MLKVFVTFSLVLICLSSCEKEYHCVCTSNVDGTLQTIDHIKTTKLGSKGYAKSCKEKEKNQTKFMDCHLD
jgi:hypothetical protein